MPSIILPRCSHPHHHHCPPVSSIIPIPSITTTTITPRSSTPANSFSSSSPSPSSSSSSYYLTITTIITTISSIQFSSVAQSCPILCNPMDCSMPGLPVHHQLPEFTQIHVHRVSDAIQLSHLLLSPSPRAFHLSQHQGLFKQVIPLHQVAKVLEFQLQHQSFQ